MTKRKAPVFSREEEAVKVAQKLGFKPSSTDDFGFGPEYDRGGPLTLAPGKGAPIGREVVIVTNSQRGRTRRAARRAS